jgi:hypothetical protein
MDMDKDTDTAAEMNKGTIWKKQRNRNRHGNAHKHGIGEVLLSIHMAL